MPATKRDHSRVDDDPLRDDPLRIVAAVLAGADDKSSLSPELGAAITSHESEVHLSPARANVVRGFEVAPHARVLVIPPTGMAVARHLAERCASVDVIAADEPEAEVARLWLEDLPGARVDVGPWRSAVASPRYDVVVWVETGGLPDRETFAREIADLAALLTPDGSLVFAADNPLGVRRLSGGADERTGRPFDAPEGFPFDEDLHLWERSTVEEAMRGAGLTAQPFAVLSDLLRVTAVATPDLFRERPQLAFELYQPGPPGPVDAIDRRALWRRLVAAGVAMDFSDALLVVGHAGAGSAHWPEDLLAAYFTAWRKVSLMTRVDFRRRGSELVVDRRLLAHPAIDRLEVSPSFIWQGGEERYVEGERLSDVMWDAKDPLAPLAQWLELAHRTPAELLDVLPWNVKLTDDGPVSFDQEWIELTRDHAARLRYGIATAVITRAAARRDRRVDPAEDARTVWETAQEWAQRLGVTLSHEDLERFVADEAALRPLVNLLPGDTAAQTRALLEQPMSALMRERADMELDRLRQRVRVLEENERARMLAERPLWRRALGRLAHALGLRRTQAPRPTQS